MKGNYWLTPEEQKEVLETLLSCPGLIKWDNQRRLPLKSGGFTDVYINLRDARDYPRVLKPIAHLYANALRRLRPDRFTEVPDSVSCFAGLIAHMTGIPYLMVREEAKEGRVSKAKVIGHAQYGEEVTAIDDVITDGASKVPVWNEWLELGLRPQKLVVLVDRQQGWQKKFAELGIDWPVWAGMTLHDVRRYLIGRGLMKRCNPVMEMVNPIILALDKLSWEEVLAIADPLRPLGCVLKVNDLAMALGFSELVPNLGVYGRVMLDLKLHDISNTVGNVCEKIRQNPPWALTVHASGGRDMMQAAVKTLEGTPTKVLAVTVLTSFNNETCEEVYGRLPKDQVNRLAKIAAEAGCHGFVCSPEEASFLKPQYLDKLIVTPGVRSAGVAKGDQKRVATPIEAIEAGADHIVGGRQFIGANDPVAEVKRVLMEELHINF